MNEASIEMNSDSLHSICDLSSMSRQSLFISYACCDIIIKSKDHKKEYKSITRFINQLSFCTRIDNLIIRKLSNQELNSLQETILNLIY